MVQDVIAIQRGTTDPDRVVIISGHIDSRNSDPMNADRDAPGANDDGSGMAAVLEAARVLSHRKFPATIVYAVLSGEEQGLYGGKVLADFAKAQGLAGRGGAQQRHRRQHPRLGRPAWSTTMCASSPKASARDETPAEAAARRRTGGELDSPSRNLARFIADRWRPTPATASASGSSCAPTASRAAATSCRCRRPAIPPCA